MNCWTWPMFSIPLMLFFFLPSLLLFHWRYSTPVQRPASIDLPAPIAGVSRFKMKLHNSMKMQHVTLLIYVIAQTERERENTALIRKSEARIFEEFSGSVSVSSIVRSIHQFNIFFQMNSPDLKRVSIWFLWIDDSMWQYRFPIPLMKPEIPFIGVYKSKLNWIVYKIPYPVSIIHVWHFSKFYHFPYLFRIFENVHYDFSDSLLKDGILNRLFSTGGCSGWSIHS